MRHAVSKELYAYWNALGAGRCAPERNDIEPGAIRGILAETFVLDFDAAAGFPFRISGSRVNALFLRELRGLSFLKLWRELDRPGIKSALHGVADESRPCLLGAEARPPGLGPLDIEITLLPLRHHGSNSFPHARLSRRQCRAPLARPRWRRPGDADLRQGARSGHPPGASRGAPARVFRPERSRAARTSACRLAREWRDLTQRNESPQLPQEQGVDPRSADAEGKPGCGVEVQHECFSQNAANARRVRCRYARARSALRRARSSTHRVLWRLHVSSSSPPFGAVGACLKRKRELVMAPARAPRCRDHAGQCRDKDAAALSPPRRGVKDNGRRPRSGRFSVSRVQTCSFPRFPPRRRVRSKGLDDHG